MNIKRILFRCIGVIALLYMFLCGLTYFLQEKIIFHPQLLSKTHQFESTLDFEELNIEVEKGIKLNALLFQSSTTSKGLVFYLHGNAGCLAGWGNVAPYYTKHGYDVCVVDYRGYGKSDGEIHNEAQFYNDIQVVYDTMKTRYDEKNIVVLGYSIGTGVASKIAKDNSPKQLILQAPYVSLTNLMMYKMPFLPTSLLKYNFTTDQFLEGLKVPVTIFHGNRDSVIPYQSSLDLQKYLKQNDVLITLNGQSHNGFTNNAVYLAEMQRLLN